MSKGQVSLTIRKHGKSTKIGARISKKHKKTKQKKRPGAIHEKRGGGGGLCKMKKSSIGNYAPTIPPIHILSCTTPSYPTTSTSTP